MGTSEPSNVPRLVKAMNFTAGRTGEVSQLTNLQFFDNQVAIVAPQTAEQGRVVVPLPHDGEEGAAYLVDQVEDVCGLSRHKKGAAEAAPSVQSWKA